MTNLEKSSQRIPDSPLAHQSKVDPLGYVEATGSTTKLKPSVALATFDPVYRARNPYTSFRNSYKGINNASQSYLYRFGRGVRNFADRPKGSTFGSGLYRGNPWVSGATTGAIGAGLGAGVGKIKDIISGTEGSAKWLSILGGLLGSGSGYTVGTMQKNSAEFTKSALIYRDPRNGILEKIQAANDLNPAQKAMYAAQVRNMNPSDAEHLFSLLRSVLGFSVGAILSKFLGVNNTFGNIIAGLAGAFGYNKLF